MCISGCTPSHPPRDDCNVNTATGQCNDPAPWGCCTLATHKECAYPTGNKAGYTCPPGYHQKFWTCPEGGRTRHCGECTQSTQACWYGDFLCSIWWDS
jgi:hypothetical protein